MNIGLSTSVIQRGKTGIAEYVFSLVANFKPYAREHRFILYVLEEDLPLFEFAAYFVHIVPVSERFRGALKNIYWHQALLPRLARRHHLDVLHVPSYRRLPWLRPCALVATVHDLAVFHLHGKYDRARMFYGRSIARVLAQRQDEIITISENTARDIAAFWDLPQGRTTVIYHGVNTNRFFPVHPAAGRAIGLTQFDLGKPFFLYVARLEHPAKNHLRLIEAFEKFKRRTGSTWQLALAGSDWHGAEKIHDSIDKSPFKNDIRRLGFVKEEDLPLLYRAAQVFVYPSLYEGFGLPAVEAMACGCPVLCSGRGALAEVTHGAAVIADPENAAAIEFELTRLASDRGLRLRLREEGLKRSRLFDWQKTAEQTLAVYQRAAGRSAERAGGVNPPRPFRVSPIYKKITLNLNSLTK